jgi:catechol-2,3-dioxygenase
MKIEKLNIYCSNLIEQIEFYTDRIGLKLISHTASEARLQIGNSELSLTKDDKFQPYHFAVNIPCNKEAEALHWFYDADKNIVEFIARKNLKNETEKTFDSESLLEISEIGVPVHDIEKAYSELNKIVELKVYDGGFERFCAIGDEHGLFICIDKQLKDWYPTGDKAHSSEFEIELTENGSVYQLEFKNGRIKNVK